MRRDDDYDFKIKDCHFEECGTAIGGSFAGSMLIDGMTVKNCGAVSDFDKVGELTARNVQVTETDLRKTESNSTSRPSNGERKLRGYVSGHRFEEELKASPAGTPVKRSNARQVKRKAALERYKAFGRSRSS